MEWVIDRDPSANGVELAVLLVLLVVAAIVAWQLYRRYTGQTVSDVNALHFTKRPHDPPE